MHFSGHACVHPAFLSICFDMHVVPSFQLTTPFLIRNRLTAPTGAGPAPVVGCSTAIRGLLNPNGRSPATYGKQVQMPVKAVKPKPGSPAKAICANNPSYQDTAASNSICQFSVGCTAWFVQTNTQLPQGHFAMATAGHCILDLGFPQQYSLDPANPGEGTALGPRPALPFRQYPFNTIHLPEQTYQIYPRLFNSCLALCCAAAFLKVS